MVLRVQVGPDVPNEYGSMGAYSVNITDISTENMLINFLIFYEVASDFCILSLEIVARLLLFSYIDNVV